MPIELKIPTVGESITEVQINEWLKAEGDTVRRDEAVAVIDSEKTTFELPAPESGTLAKILHQAGETVSVGAIIARIEPEGVAAPVEHKSKRPEAGPTRDEKPDTGHRPKAKPNTGSQPPAEESAPSDRGTKRATARPAKTEPAGRKGPGTAALERRPDETGPEHAPAADPGLLAEGKHPPEPAPSPFKEGSDQEEEMVPMTMLRRTIARRLIEAQQTMAMLTTFNEADMSAVQSLRHKQQEAFQKRYGVKLGLMSFFVKAAIDGLKQFPQLNAEVRGNDIVYRNYFDIGIAIAAERGLVVPVLRRAERLSFAEVEQAIAEFARRAKENELKPEDLSGGTFTITNGGVFGSLLSTPILNPPQSGILGLHAIADRPVAREGGVVIRPMMYLALTYDHRIVDGREAVLFLRRVQEAIEDPARMLVEV
jgi:2-oxoglutarate dehydrogenase E2 component (dihydrolipoamide succinyltransferase)